MKPRVPVEPGPDLGMFVRRVVVDDQVEFSPGWGLAVDLIEEADEFLMPVTGHALADDLAVEDIERGEQRGRAVAFVVVRHRPATALLHRQPRLGAVERLDLMGWIELDPENEAVG